MRCDETEGDDENRRSSCLELMIEFEKYIVCNLFIDSLLLHACSIIDTFDTSLSK